MSKKTHSKHAAAAASEAPLTTEDEDAMYHMLDGYMDAPTKIKTSSSSKKASAAAAAPKKRKAVEAAAATEEGALDLDFDHPAEAKGKASSTKSNDGPTIEEMGDDIEPDEEERTTAKKAVSSKKPRLILTEVTHTRPTVAAAATAAAAAPSKAEQLRALLESMTSEEKKGFQVTEPDDEPAAAASSTKQVVTKPTRDPVFLTLAPKEDYTGPPRTFMEEYNITVDTMASKVGYGWVRATHPDQAMQLFLRYKDNQIHLLDFQTDEQIKKIFVKRTEAKKPPPAGSADKKWLSSGVHYVNLWSKMDQRWNGKKEQGLLFMTPFGCGAYGRVGPTVDTGVEGDRGRTFDGVRKNDSESSVGIAISNMSYSHLVKDKSTGNNATMDAACKVMRRITKYIAMTTFNIPGSLPGWRKEHDDELADLNRQQQMAFLFKSNAFKGKVDYSEEDKMDTIKANASCFRKRGGTWFNGKKVDEEDLGQYRPPSDLYEKIKMDNDGNLLLHNAIDVQVCRRPQDVDPANLPSSNTFSIPFENAVINAYTDVFAIVYRVAVYEWKQKKADVTHKIASIIWLNTKAALEGLEMSDIMAHPCDPRYSVPMAGKYVGPLEALKQLPAGVDEGNGVVSFAPSSKAAPVDHDPDFDAFAS